MIESPNERCLTLFEVIEFYTHIGHLLGNREIDMFQKVTHPSAAFSRFDGSFGEGADRMHDELFWQFSPILFNHIDDHRRGTAHLIDTDPSEMRCPCVSSIDIET